MKADKEWAKALYVSTSLGGQRLIVSTKGAMELLKSEWPVTSGNGYINALVICQSVMDNRLPPDYARDAFLEAAREAGVDAKDPP